MSLDKIHSELLDYVNIIYMYNYDTSQKIDHFLLSITGSARQFLNSFMKIYNYSAKDYTNILIEITRFSKSNSYQIIDNDYYKCVNDGIIPDGKEELIQTVEIE